MPPKNLVSRHALLAALMASAVLATACGGGQDTENAASASATATGRASESAQAISPSSTGTWTRIAGEYAYFKLATRSFVRYGTGDNWVGKYVEAGSAQCASDFFGSDPAPGVTKACEVYADTTAPVAPAPAPAPAPSPSPSPTPAPAATGSALLSWNAPTGSVSGYRVYYGTSAGSYEQPKGSGLFVTNTTTTVPNLDSGTTYYFAVTAVTAGGEESTYSSEATKAVP